MAQKYRQGDCIKSLDELMRQENVFIHGKVTNIGWYQNWQLHMAQYAIENNQIRRAIRKVEKSNENDG